MLYIYPVCNFINYSDEFTVLFNITCNIVYPSHCKYRKFRGNPLLTTNRYCMVDTTPPYNFIKYSKLSPKPYTSNKLNSFSSATFYVCVWL